MRANGSVLNGSVLNGSVLPRDPPAEDAPRRPPWVTSTLAAILIFTIVVDLLGNLLVVLSVYRNKKLRNAVNCSKPATVISYS